MGGEDSGVTCVVVGCRAAEKGTVLCCAEWSSVPRTLPAPRSDGLAAESACAHLRKGPLCTSASHLRPRWHTPALHIHAAPPHDRVRTLGPIISTWHTSQPPVPHL